MKRTAIALTIVMGSFFASAACVAKEATQAVECQEDQPCWDCETMGNRVCGPDPYNGLTIPEQAAEECEQPEVVEEFAKGDHDACYDIMVGEITTARASR